MSGQKIEISQLPWVDNICQQRLKEVWKSGQSASIAFVEMDPGNISLPHRHNTFTEVYFILSGQGVLSVGDEKFEVRKDTLVEILPGIVHRLENTGNEILVHLVISVPAFNPEDVKVLEVTNG